MRSAVNLNREELVTGSTASRLAKLTLALPHLVLCALLAALLAVAEQSPHGFQTLMQEDGWAEWATFVTFVAAAVLAALRVREPSLEKLERCALVALGLFCAFVAAEEISWAQRLLGYRPPRLFLEHNFQQEANLHNLLKDVLDTRFVVALIALGYGVLAPFLRYLALVPGALAPALSLAPYFACIAFLELSYPYELVGELAELALGALLLVDIAERTNLQPLRAAKVAASGQLVALTVAVLLVPLNGAILGLHREAFTRSAQGELERLAEDMRAGLFVRAPLFKKAHVHKRLYTASRAGYVELAPDDFALDPWNNPYWISFRKGAHGDGTLLLYSFGANHRRESDVDRLTDASFALEGDDLGVVLSVRPPQRAAR
jgi:hypothetical protein